MNRLTLTEHAGFYKYRLEDISGGGIPIESEPFPTKEGCIAAAERNGYLANASLVDDTSGE